MDEAEQVTNALIAQWLAEDMNPASAREDGFAVENKKEEREVDEEVSTVASDISG